MRSRRHALSYRLSIRAYRRPGFGVNGRPAVSSHNAPAMDGTAIVVCDGFFATANGKTAHGLVRGTDRYRDPRRHRRADGRARRRRGPRRQCAAGSPSTPRSRRRCGARRDARLLRRRRGDLGGPRDAGPAGAARSRQSTPACRSSTACTSSSPTTRSSPRRPPAGASRSATSGRPRGAPSSTSGAARSSTVEAPRLAVLGTDCALGKRTTARFLLEACRRAGIRAELIFTGQTGWMQGAPFGFIFDSIPNDFVSGELEHAVVSCWRAARPDLILLEGQSALRNPSGPCGSEFLLSGQRPGRHPPARAGADVCYEGLEELDLRIPPVSDEIALIRTLGARTLAVTLNGEHMSPEALRARAASASRGARDSRRPPLEEGVEALVPVVREFLASEAQAREDPPRRRASLEEFALTRPYAIAGQEPSTARRQRRRPYRDGRRPRRPRRRLARRARHRRDGRELPRGALRRRTSSGSGAATSARFPRSAARPSERFPLTPAARAAVDIALHDLLAQRLGVPLAEMLGRVHEALPTSITIGIKPVAETLAEADEYLGRGFRVLKVKIGDSLEEDLERLARLRERVGTRAVAPRRRQHRLHARGDGALLRARRTRSTSSSSSSP